MKMRFCSLEKKSSPEQDFLYCNVVIEILCVELHAHVGKNSWKRARSLVGAQELAKLFDQRYTSLGLAPLKFFVIVDISLRI